MNPCLRCGQPCKRKTTKYCSNYCYAQSRIGLPSPKKGRNSDPVPRFWRKVDQRSPDECWEWTGSRTMQGYGTLMLTVDPYQTVRAHRLSWEIHNGAIPADLWVLHHCDNPPCVNPAHLYLGTPRENARDRASRNRGWETKLRGENHPTSKLSDAQIAEIRSRHAEGESQGKLAKEFGIRQGSVSRIVRGLSR